MNNLRNFIIRTIAIITTLLAFAFLSCNLEMSKTSSIIWLFVTLVIFSGICYFSLRNHTEQEIKKILGISWLEKKTGINFTEE